MKIVTIVLAALLWAAPALAAPGPNLATSMTAPPPTFVYDVGRYTVTVANIGNQHAPGVVLTIALPPTHTSPQVYVLGNVIGYAVGCTRSNTTLTCNLGQVNKGTSRSVYVDLELPYSAAPLVIAASATTTGNDPNLANNSANLTAAVLYHDVTAGPAGAAINRHCTGTGLTAFFECTLFPSSIASHDADFHADFTVTLPLAPTYTGTWSRSSASQLTFQYFDGATLLATFNGRGVSADCFEGLTTFPGSTYVSPYEVCF